MVMERRISCGIGDKGDGWFEIRVDPLGRVGWSWGGAVLWHLAERTHHGVRQEC